MTSPEPEKVTLEKQLGDRTGPLVLVWSEYPVIPGPAGRLLQHRARVRLESARQLLSDARRQRALAEKAGGFAPYELQWTVAVTWRHRGLLSLVEDRTLRLGLRGTCRSRRSVTLQEQTGQPVPLARLIDLPRSRKRILARVLVQAEALNADGCSLYRDWRRRCIVGFHPERYYLTGDGIVIWYPWLFLGPAGIGSPSFLVPWSDLDMRQPWSLS